MDSRNERERERGGAGERERENKREEATGDEGTEHWMLREDVGGDGEGRWEK